MALKFKNRFIILIVLAVIVLIIARFVGLSVGKTKLTSRDGGSGQQGATDGKFDTAKSVNLNGAGFEFGDNHKGHSAQFRSTIQKRWTCWTKALEDMSITPDSP